VSVFAIIARVLGVILLLAWLVYIPVGRHWFRRSGGLMYATIFQWHILPFIIGTGLLASGNSLVILALPVAWILSIFFPNFFMFVFPLVTGWINGGLVCSYFYQDPKLLYYVYSAVGTLVTFLVCTVITAIVAGPFNWPWER